ncbi:prepilin peptidase [Micromonospora sp. CA-263727]|uniref:prepilin peptidase n=1 Tax=Micromonospora sp. CA-263727 TaxID=3239967 RepID=UPI003D8E1824
MIAGVPMAAIAHGVPAAGQVRLPRGWWAGGAAQPRFVIATAACTGLVAAMIGAAVPVNVTLPAFWIFAVVGVGLAVVDVRRRRLPHRLTGMLWASSGLCFVVSAHATGDTGDLARACAVGAIVAAVMLVIALALPGQLGFGDVVFTGAITFNLGWLSWQAAAIGLLAGLLLQAALAVVGRLRRSGNSPTPMGPALVAGWCLGAVVGS